MPNAGPETDCMSHKIHARIAFSMFGLPQLDPGILPEPSLYLHYKQVNPLVSALVTLYILPNDWPTPTPSLISELAWPLLKTYLLS